MPVQQNVSSKVFMAHAGTLYYCFTNGHKGYRLFQFTKTWTEITTANSGILSTEIRDMVGKDSSIYYATTSGLSIKRGSKWTSVTTGNSTILSNDVKRVKADGHITAILTDKGLSYQIGQTSSWKNVSKTSLNMPSLSNPGHLMILGDTIYWTPYTAFDIVKFDTKSETSTLVKKTSPRVVGFASDDSTPYLLGGNELFSITDSLTPLYNLKSWEGIGTNIPIITDKKGRLWHIKPWSGLLTLSTIENEKYKPAQYEIPVPIDVGRTNLLAYDQVTDSVYSLSHDICFSLDDVRNPTENYRKEMALLDINLMSTPILNDGILHKDLSFFSASCEAPKGSGKSPLFSSGLWIGGLDDTNDIHLAAMTYRQGGADFWPAPLHVTTGEYNPNDSARFDRVWKVNKTDVQRHINRYNLHGEVMESQTSEAIWNWPGNGSVGNADQLAPYIDRNENGVYEPGLGDYPDIPGDQCIYWIMNDKAHPHGESGATPFGIEIHGMAYAYNCSDLSNTSDGYGINYSTFYRYNVINRSNQDYKDVVIGTWTDPDVGNNTDDYVGSHVTQNMGFAYNGDANDEGLWGYGINAPMISTVILDAPTKMDDGVDGDGDGTVDEDDEKRMMGSFFYYDNDWSNFGNPQEPVHYNNYLHGKWKNGDCLTMDFQAGRTGSECTNYIYPGTSNPQLTNQNWTERTAQNMAADRRFLIASFPFDLKASDTAIFEYALVYSRDSSQYDQLPQNLKYVKAMKEWYYGTGHPGCYDFVSTQSLSSKQHAKVYPVPADQLIHIEAQSAIKKVVIIDLNGRIVSRYEPDMNLGEAEVSLTGLNAGIYFIETTTEEGLLTNKIIKR